MAYKDKQKQYLAQKEWIQAHPERSREYSRQTRLKWKIECFIAYGGLHCACPSGQCRETELKFLTLDHIDGNGAKHRAELFGGTRQPPRFNIYLWLKKQGYPLGYRVLCYNCNCAMGHNKGVCPHERGLFV